MISPHGGRHDAGHLAERIVGLLRDPARRQRYGVANRELIVERNNFETEMAKVESLYAELAVDASVRRC